MFRYPLDQDTTNELYAHLLNHDKHGRESIKKLLGILSQALNETEDEETYWQEEASNAIKFHQRLKVDHENRIFDEKNTRLARSMEVKPVVASENPAFTEARAVVAEQKATIDVSKESHLNKIEESFGEAWTEEDLAKHFNEQVPVRSKKKDKEKNPDFHKMSLQDIEAWEKKQDNSNDIYKISARVKNLARGSGGVLTPVGDMLCNSFTHVLKDMYDFFETIPDKDIRIKCIERMRRHEGMPGTLVSAAGAGVTRK